MAIVGIFKRKAFSPESKMVQGAAIFTTIIAVLPWLLILRTGEVKKNDGVILILSFFAYAWWLFSKDDRLKKYTVCQERV